MDRQIGDRFSDAVLAEAQERYGIVGGTPRLLGATENFVYEYERGGQSYILRIGHSSRRTENLVEGEVDWINYLAAAGIPVARAIRSDKGQLVERIGDGAGTHFIATTFVKAQGQPVHGRWSPSLYATFGALLGRMHALSATYAPPLPAWRRPEWHDDIMDVVSRYLPASERVAREKYEAQCERVRGLPTDSSCYGLIHFDAHGGNMLLDETGRLSIFDFDDCVYSWYANDIAIALFAMVTDAPDVPKLTRDFLTHFLEGYRVIYRLEDRWLRELPIFLKMVEIFLYAVIHRDFDPNHITDAWCARFMRNRKYRIENDVPTIDFDFESLGVHTSD